MFIASSLHPKIHARSPPIQPSSQCQSCLIGADTRSAFNTRFSKPASIVAKIQEMLHPRNWCLCRWNSSIVTISVKWQQCSPDHCLRDDILLNSISFLIIFSCSIHHLSLCSPPLLSAQNIFLASHQAPPPFSSHMWFHSTWLPLPLWNVLSLRDLVKKGPSDMFRSVNAWCRHPYCIRRAFHISCMNVLLKHSHGWLVWF